MPVYEVPLEDMKFVLDEVLDIEHLSKLKGFEDATPDLIHSVLEEGAKLCQDVLFPLNQSGDQEGCTHDADTGDVTTPKGFKEAYKIFSENGWVGVAGDPEYGGMGLPFTVNTVMHEMICSANMSFGMYPGLSQGAYDAIHIHGTDEQKQTYLPKILDGSWTGTMNLTEPHCGTDLGLIKAKATPNDDGSFNINATKIFISAGEHDMAENIVHLVLAKLPDAPDGVKGISLFVVPKFFPQDDGSIGERNNVKCGAIEHKMGIHANSTCVMNYEDAKGWLVGQPHKGLKAMFTMMNAARLAVAMQGLGIAEIAYQNAASYAKERLQMRALSGAKYPDKPADPIIVHPDVRRMLLTSKAFCEGARALAFYTAYHIDIADRTECEKERQAADDLVALLTPIVKGYFTDMGSEIANLAVQTYGGHGYIAEYGIEQYIRDARIAQIYEGTNGIQALDLVGRKMGQGYGRLLRRFFHPAQNFIEENQNNEDLQEFLFPFAKAFAKLQQASATVASKGLAKPDEAGAAATDYMRMFSLVALGYMWLKMIVVAQEGLKDESKKDKHSFYENKIHTGRFFFQRMLPEADGKFKMVMAGADSMMALDEAAF